MSSTFQTLIDTASSNGLTELRNYAENYKITQSMRGYDTVNMKDFLEHLQTKGNTSLVMQAASTWESLLGTDKVQACQDTLNGVLTVADSKNYSELYNLIKQYQAENPDNWYEDYDSRIKEFIRGTGTTPITLMQQFDAVSMSLASNKLNDWSSSITTDSNVTGSSAAALSGASDSANDGNSAITTSSGASAGGLVATESNYDTGGYGGDNTSNPLQNQFWVKNLVTGTTTTFIFTLEDISDSVGASWDTQNVRGRSTPIVGYEGSEQRQISINVTLHRDWFCSPGEDLTTVVNNLKALVYPGYSGYMIIPPTCLLKLGSMVFAAGYMTSVDVSWQPPIDNGCYMMAEVAMSFSAAPSLAYQASEIESGSDWLG